MQVTVNGNVQEVATGITIAELLQHLKLDPRFLAVERNCELVSRKHHVTCQLTPGDQIEIVTLVGGG